MTPEISIREEGALVPQGASVTYMPDAPRLHVTYRDGNRFIHFAIPRANPFDLTQWCVTDDTEPVKRDS